MNLNECKWRYDGDGFYETTCRNTFSFIRGRLRGSRFVYCPYCGCYIKEQKA